VVAATAWAGWPWHHLGLGAAAGLGLGLLLTLFYFVPNRWLRSGTVLTIAGLVTGAFVLTMTWYPEWFPRLSPQWFAVHLLSAALLVHLLAFTGRTEESELECGLTTMFVAASLWVLLPERGRLLGLLIPLVWYVIYTGTMLPHVQVLKHVLRGWNYLELGQFREAILSFRRALEIQPYSAWAREGLWRVHRKLTADLLAQQPQLRELLDLDLCLQRVAELLLQGSPSTSYLEEADKLLNLVLDQDPNRRPEVLYWRAVLLTHGKHYDSAAEALLELLDRRHWPGPSPSRDSILARAWQLALLAHDQLTRRVEELLWQIPGKRIEAIADIEGALKKQPNDSVALELKEYLYSGLTYEEFEVVREADLDSVGHLDFSYLYEQGQQLLQQAERWQQGVGFLRMAAYGFAEKAPGIYYQLGELYRQRNDEATARYYYEQAKLAARDYGLDRLPAEEKQAYFRAVHQLAQFAYQNQDLDRAIENFILYMESPQAGTDTLRLITELYERKGDALSALIWNEKALSLDSSNPQLLERKDRYYYSVTPEDLLAQRPRVEKHFDAEYCLRKAKMLVDLRQAGEPQLEWALHLVRLVLALDPNNLRALVLAGRVFHRVGNEEEAARHYERARAARPERFSSRDEEEAWYWATVRLGDYYLSNARRPDLALQCYSDYRNSPKSGADTLYKMGQCYEQLGDTVRAAKCYQAVTVYDHPLASEAYAALARLEAAGRSNV
ncbi:MAG: tetratricopeptide repeat protein, partial [Gemmatales bacterium]|nr:tetratricopeptide repeat protein [Gemmatales bacterium]MDW8175223.1 tetratricopeptide repeat protein [Gemmatales bacterium]